MRKSFLVSLILAILLGGLFWYKHADLACLVPISYKVGTVDERFGISETDFEEILASAAKMWSEVMGKDLFIYNNSSNFAVNLIYDERQKLARSEEEWRLALDEKEKTGKQIMTEVEKMNQNYLDEKESLKKQYEAYENNLDNFNRKVEEYNQKEETSPEVYADLQNERQVLETTLANLTLQETNLANLVTEINDLGKRGNEVIAEYNLEVKEYNDRFGNLENFTQGDFKRERINVYKFDNKNELKRVLVHEFGHALGVGHVDDSEAIMYYLTTDKFEISTLAEADIVALKSVCVDEDRLLSRLWRFIYYL